MAYCNYSDVGLLLQFTYDTNSNPTAAKVTDVIALIASEIEMALIGVGIALPVAGTNLYNLVRLNNMYGAAGIIGVTYYRNTEDIDGSQGDYYRKLYMEFLLNIKKNPNFYNSVSGGSNSTIGNQVTAGYETAESITDVLIGNDWVD
jgi:hypothetical protein